MNYLPEMIDVLNNSSNIALATLNGTMPNVRFVSFIHDEQSPNILYFATNGSNQKVVEFTKNPQVAIASMPNNQNDVANIRSHNATVKKSSKTLDDIVDVFLKKFPDMQEVFDAVQEDFMIYEITMHEVALTLDYSGSKELVF